MPNPYSSLGPDDYQTAALNLLPRGWAWPRGLETVLAAFWGAVADILFLFHADTTTVVDVELVPSTTQALLPNFEEDWGLPNPCTPQPQTIEQRHAALMSKITQLGSLSKQFYIDLAAALGFVITITEFRPTTCLSCCTAPVYTAAWRFAWQVNAPETTVSLLTCTGFCTSPLRSWGNQPLECAIARVNRASRFVLFSYES